MKCFNCQEEVPEHMRSCVVCGNDAGYPNVRAAARMEEVNALQQRINKAEETAASLGYKSILEDFHDVVAKSTAVICCPLGKLHEFVSSDNSLYQTFYQAVGSEGRLPEDNKWDNIRESVDSLLFPHYHEHIRFGSLSIDRSGISDYGPYSMVLKEMAIKDRASVFEENAISFVKKHRIVAGNSIPPGYRALWMQRALLAIAKLGNRLTHTTTNDEFSKLLASSDDKDADFIEVHIYGPIHRRAIEHLSGYTPSRKADKVILKSVTKKLEDIGATVEIS